MSQFPDDLDVFKNPKNKEQFIEAVVMELIDQKLISDEDPETEAAKKVIEYWFNYLKQNKYILGNKLVEEAEKEAKNEFVPNFYPGTPPAQIKEEKDGDY